MVKNNKIIFLLLPLIVLSFAFIFCACGENKDAPNKISLIENSCKTQYFVGEEVDLTGAKFKVTYANGTEEEFSVDSEFIEFDTAYIQNQTAGKKTLTVIFNKVADSKIYVNIVLTFVNVELVDFELVEETLPISIKQNAELDTSAVKGIATYSNGETKEIKAEEMEFSNLDSSIYGDELPVIVTFGEINKMFTIKVEQLSIVRIGFSGGIYSTYSLGVDIDLSLILVELELDDGTFVNLRGNSLDIEDRKSVV